MVKLLCFVCFFQAKSRILLFSGHKKLVRTAFRNLKDAIASFNHHKDSKYHVNVIYCFESLKRKNQGTNVAVTFQKNDGYSLRITV